MCGYLNLSHVCSYFFCILVVLMLVLVAGTVYTRDQKLGVGAYTVWAFTREKWCNCSHWLYSYM